MVCLLSVSLSPLRDEGTSYHYAPPSRFMEIDERARKAIEKAILQHNLKYQEVMTWTTDGFFRETKEKVHVPQKRRMCRRGNGMLCSCRLRCF